MNKTFKGNCIDVLKKLKPNSVDSIVTDPPYGLSFMGKNWDYEVPSVEIWKECLRVLKPGGHLLSFSGTRTYHRMAVNIEDAGFEIRDQIQWLYGSGFPKSHNISKAIDKKFGAKRNVISSYKATGTARNSKNIGAKTHSAIEGEYSKDVNEIFVTSPSTPQAREWEGWGTALKPACEPVCLARKPLIGDSIAENVMMYGTGGLNIDECRVETSDNLNGGTYSEGAAEIRPSQVPKNGIGKKFKQPKGRFPANVIFDEEAGKVLDEQSGILKSGARKRQKQKSDVFNAVGSKMKYTRECSASSGGASRFFYCAKASKRERNEGLEGMEVKEVLLGNNQAAIPKKTKDGKVNKVIRNENYHPTVKPIKLMEYLIKLVTPKYGVVLDPFMGSGTTCVAAKGLDYKYIGIEMNVHYLKIARARIDAVKS